MLSQFQPSNLILHRPWHIYAVLHGPFPTTVYNIYLFDPMHRSLYTCNDFTAALCCVICTRKVKYMIYILWHEEPVQSYVTHTQILYPIVCTELWNNYTLQCTNMTKSVSYTLLWVNKTNKALNLHLKESILNTLS